jgi:hypothetical protein
VAVVYNQDDTVGAVSMQNFGDVTIDDTPRMAPHTSYDPVTGQSRTFDPETGLTRLYDPLTGQSQTHDPATGNLTAFNAITGEMTVTTYDPATGVTTTVNPATGETRTFDPASGQSTTVDVVTGQTAIHDTITGETSTYDPDTGQTVTYNPFTGPTTTDDHLIFFPPISSDQLAPGDDRPTSSDETSTGTDAYSDVPTTVDPDSTGAPPLDETYSTPSPYDPDTDQTTYYDPNTGEPIYYDSNTGDGTYDDSNTGEPTYYDPAGVDAPYVSATDQAVFMAGDDMTAPDMPGGVESLVQPFGGVDFDAGGNIEVDEPQALDWSDTTFEWPDDGEAGLGASPPSGPFDLGPDVMETAGDHTSTTDGDLITPQLEDVNDNPWASPGDGDSGYMADDFVPGGLDEV